MATPEEKLKITSSDTRSVVASVKVLVASMRVSVEVNIDTAFVVVAATVTPPEVLSTTLGPTKVMLVVDPEIIDNHTDEVQVSLVAATI